MALGCRHLSLLVSAPGAGLLHPFVGEEFDPDGVCHVLRGEITGDAVFAQRARRAYEFTGGTPQHARESGEFGTARRGDAALPGDDQIGCGVRQPVRGSQAVRDVLGPHSESCPQSSGGQGVEGRGGLLGLRLVHAHKVWVGDGGDYGLFGHNYRL